MRKQTKNLLVLTLLAAGVSLASCGNSGSGATTYTYHTYVTVSPSNWNQLSYEDANDTSIMDWINSNLFEYNFEFDADGKIVEGGYSIDYSAATDLRDVTSEFAGLYNVPKTAGEHAGFAWEITLREDLKWDDGTPINAEDFIYSMKEQLNPLYKHYRADSYYKGATVIANARDYVYQGSHGYVSPIVSESFGDDEYIPMDRFETVEGKGWGFYELDAEGNKTDVFHDIQLKVTSGGNWGNKGLAALVNAGYDTPDGDGAALVSAANKAGELMLTAENIVHLQNWIAIAMHGKESLAAYAESAGDYAYMEWQEMAYLGADFREMDFSEVGFFKRADSDYKFVLVLDNPLLLKKYDEEGNDIGLSYLAAYNLSSLPLVKKDLYEQCRVEPATEGGLWTTTYNTTLDKTASWGPYSLKSFQLDKQFTLTKNENWFGFGIDQYKGQYQTTDIVYDVITSWQTAWLQFQQGDLTSIGMDVTIANEYKNSQRAVFTPDDYVGSMQLQSSYEALKNRESDGVNKTILAQKDFRNALSLAVDRAAYTQACTTASQTGFGLFNSMHYYDVSKGAEGCYRNTDVAKKVLCEVYGVDYTTFGSLDEAVNSITGFDLAQAREKLVSAYNAALGAGDIKGTAEAATDKVVLTVGSAADNEAFTRVVNFLQSSFTVLAEGTPLEGKIELDKVEKGDKWAESFRAGEYEICTGGWSGAAWDPGYMLMAYLSPDYMYSAAWDTSAASLTFNPYGDDVEEHNYTMSLWDWWCSLNANPSSAHANYVDFTAADSSVKCAIIAALEGAILKTYYTVPLYNYYSATILSYQVEYATRTYNTFMGYGGVRYLTYKYTDGEWANVKAGFDYKA